MPPVLASTRTVISCAGFAIQAPRSVSRTGPSISQELDAFLLGGRQAGMVGRVVGAFLAVLVAEELFASGCELLISLTSAGQIRRGGDPPVSS